MHAGTAHEASYTARHRHRRPRRPANASLRGLRERSGLVTVCLAIGLTALLLQLIRCPHPPAGATTLIVALGILRTTPQLRTMALAVVGVATVAAVVHLRTSTSATPA